MPQALEQGNISRKPSGQRPMMRQTHKHMLCEFKSAEHTRIQLREINRKGVYLNVFVPAQEGLIALFFFFYAHKTYLQ